MSDLDAKELREAFREAVDTGHWAEWQRALRLIRQAGGAERMVILWLHDPDDAQEATGGDLTASEVTGG